MIQDAFLQSENVSTSSFQCCPSHAKLQTLKQKKTDLESLLNEKNKLLELILKEEQDLRKISSNKLIIDEVKRRTLKNSSLPASPLTDHKLPATLPNHGKPSTNWNDNDHLKYKNKHEVQHSGSTNGISKNSEKPVLYPHKYYQWGNMKTVPTPVNTFNQQYLCDKDNNIQFIAQNKNLNIDNDNNDRSLKVYLGKGAVLEQESIVLEPNVPDYYCLQPMQIPLTDTLLSTKGLGGYWIPLENNERMWVSSEEQQFTYVNRKNSQIKRSDAMSGSKSSSVGNFLLLSDKCEDTTDSVSLSSFYSEHKKQQKEKKWSETSMDGPMVITVGPKPRNKTSHREKNKLSSQSMLLPNRSNIIPHHVPPHHQEYHHSSQYMPALPPKPTDNLTLQFSPNQNQNNNVFAQKDIFHSMQCVPSQLSPSSSKQSEVNDILIESPKNVHVIQHAKIRPYKEISKPFEMADFYKYSTKYRQQKQATVSVASSTLTNQGFVDENVTTGNRTEFHKNFSQQPSN